MKNMWLVAIYRIHFSTLSIGHIDLTVVQFFLILCLF